MNCPNCGALLTENAKFCVSCGAKINEDASNPSAGNSSNAGDSGASYYSSSGSGGRVRALFKSLPRYKIAILIAGTFLIIVGIGNIASSVSYISYATFGNDYSTYVYRGVREISNLVASIGRSIGWFFVVFGVIIDVNALFRYN